MSLSKSKSVAETYQTTYSTTQDNSLTTGAGDVIGLTGAQVGGNLSITSANADLAGSAIAAAKDFAENSNAIASQVADSQRAFVETASGQKTFLWGAAILAAIALIPRLKKS